jgi:tetratricopeptide (TPR) repeat protein
MAAFPRRRATMKTFVILAALSVSSGQSAQEPPNLQKLFEAGRYEQAINAIASQGDQASPDAIYLAGQSYLRLRQPDNARAQFAKLSAGVPAEEPTPWSLVGQSETARIGGNTQLAIDTAKRAGEMAPEAFYPRYQLGMAYSTAEKWEPAAEAFDKAAAIDPSFAYAHYYAGLAYSKLNRVSRMATHFEDFLKLAPEAPERPAVQSLMRTVRGR